MVKKIKKIKLKGNIKESLKGKNIINTEKVNNEMKNFKDKFKKGSAWEKVFTILTLLIVAVFAIGVLFAIYIVIAAPAFDMEQLYTKEASVVYDASGNEIARLGTENREKVTYDQLPEVFVDALIATEDSRFFQHSGLDMARFLKATLGQLVGASGAGGASTLTMQVVKQTYTDTVSSGIKGIVRKFTDIYMSVFKVEKNYTKEQIIEFYVNLPYLGSGTYGIQQASETYFGKTISELSLPEAAMIAGLFQAPGAYDPYDYPEKAEARRNQVLNLMKKHGYITSEECETAKKIKVKSLLVSDGSTINTSQGYIDTVVSEVIKRTGKDPALVSMKIYSTMIQEKQNVINNLYNGTTYKWPNDTVQAAIAVTDVDSGAIIAVGAGRNKKGERSLNYATAIKRHPGSTAKPIFDYGPAFEYLNFSTGNTVIDDQYTYSNGGSIKNWDNQYKGIQTAKVALGQSRNIPALQVFQQLDQKDLNNFVTGLGITPEYEKGSTFINESHSIGGFTGVNPLQMSAAYGAFARGGVFIEPYSFTKIEFMDSGETYTVTPEKRTVMSEATAYMINMSLKYAVTSGAVAAGSKSGTDVASKTGTSTIDSSVKDKIKEKNIIGDSWQLVYSPDYVCALWVGYDKTTATQYLTNSMGSKIKKAIAKELTSNMLDANSRWEEPSTVQTATIELETIPLTLASDYTPENLKSVEYFKKGTVPDEISNRFSQLDNPTNLKASYAAGTTTLTWTGIPTPAAIDETALKKYFDEGYKTFSDKYYQKRLTYNSNYIGTNGYHVYVSNGGSFTDLGFTTGTSYKYTGVITGTTTFMVKSSYSIFTANMSSGVTVQIDSNGSVTPTPTKNWSLEINGDDNMTVFQYMKMLDTGELPVVVKNLGYNISRNPGVSIKNICTDSSDNVVDCGSMDCTQSYTVSHAVSYNGITKNIIQQLKAGC